jgi:hypothetical protein
MIKNLHFLLILGPKHDISKRHLKRCILTLFLRFFWQEITSKKFKSNIFRLNSTRAIDWCMNCHISLRKNFGQFLPNRWGDPYHKKKSKFFPQLTFVLRRGGHFGHLIFETSLSLILDLKKMLSQFLRQKIIP